MRFKKLGRTGLFVSEFCLGTMTFGGGDDMWGEIGRLGQREANALLRDAIDGGINFIDTADVYSGGRSEEITGEAIRNLGLSRDELVIATKGFGRTGDGPNQGGASRYHLIDACKASLTRLQLEHVDLYQVHGFDPATPIEETMHALDTLVEQGLVRYVGFSNWAAWQIVKAIGIAERLGLQRPVSLQAYYTVAGRDLEREIVPMLASEDVGLLVWSPLAGGYLSGKYTDGGGDAVGARRNGFDFPPVDVGRGEASIAALRQVADARGTSPARIALAWLLHQPVVTSVIVGAKRSDQLLDNLGASDVVLSEDELAILGTAGALPAEYPAWMIERQGGFRREILA